MAGYIKFDGVDGESLDKDHKNWINLLSMSQAIHQPGGGATGSTRRRGDVILEDIHCVKEMDKSTPKIIGAVCNGKVYPKVQIHFTTSTTDEGRQTYWDVEMKNVMVTQYNASGACQSDQVPTEDFSLNFEQIKWTYCEMDAKGSKKGNVVQTWQVEKGQA